MSISRKLENIPEDGSSLKQTLYYLAEEFPRSKWLSQNSLSSRLTPKTKRKFFHNLIVLHNFFAKTWKYNKSSSHTCEDFLLFRKEIDDSTISVYIGKHFDDILKKCITPNNSDEEFSNQELSCDEEISNQELSCDEEEDIIEQSYEKEIRIPIIKDKKKLLTNSNLQKTIKKQNMKISLLQKKIQLLEEINKYTEQIQEL